MSKQLKFEFEGTNYCLEFSRNTASDLFDKGFNDEAIGKNPPKYIPMLFEAAFQKNHKATPKSTIKKIFESIEKKKDDDDEEITNSLVLKLIEMLNESVEALVDDSDDKEGKIKWETNW